MDKIRAIIPAAGKGNRLKSICEGIPKAMVRIDNIPMLETVLENVNFIDEKDIYIVVGCYKEKILEYFKDKYNYVEQKEQLGTGHAVMGCASQFADFDGTVLITFGDMPLFRKNELEAMCRQHIANKADCTLMTAENPDLEMWARVLRDEQGAFKAIVEGKDCTAEEFKIKELFSGVMAFNSKALFDALPQVGCQNAQNEYYVTEVPELMVKKGLKVETYFIPDGNDLRGVNTPEDMEVCKKLLEERRSLA